MVYSHITSDNCTFQIELSADHCDHFTDMNNPSPSTLFGIIFYSSAFRRRAILPLISIAQFSLENLKGIPEQYTQYIKNRDDSYRKNIIKSERKSSDAVKGRNHLIFSVNSSDNNFGSIFAFLSPFRLHFILSLPQVIRTMEKCGTDFFKKKRQLRYFELKFCYVQYHRYDIIFLC